MSAVEVRELTRAEAEQLTQSIRRGLDDIGAKLERAHDGKAWKGMGYRSWADYLSGEFNMSKSRGYQLVAHARFVREVQASTNVDVSTLPEGATRQLAGRADEYAKRLAEIATSDGAADDADLARTVADEMLRPAVEPQVLAAAGAARTRSARESGTVRRAARRRSAAGRRRTKVFNAIRELGRAADEAKAENDAFSAGLVEQREWAATFKAEPGDDWKRRERAQLASVRLIRTIREFAGDITPQDLAHMLDTGFDYVKAGFSDDLAECFNLLDPYREVLPCVAMRPQPADDGAK